MSCSVLNMRFSPRASRLRANFERLVCQRQWGTVNAEGDMSGRVQRCTGITNAQRPASSGRGGRDLF
jgi:hypothetical protein